MRYSDLKLPFTDSLGNHVAFSEYQKDTLILYRRNVKEDGKRIDYGACSTPDDLPYL
jgi:hypothetical protein